MQNKANFKKVKLNVTKVLTRDYDQLDTWSIRKTKPIQSQSKPIQSQFKANSKPIKANSKPIKANFRGKKCCSPLLCCGIYKEKMIFCNRINRKSQIV
jgi:hypothetical protein